MLQSDFEQLLDRIRSGDEQAAREFVEHFEPEIRRIARVRMRDHRIRALTDSVDVVQSVFGDFFHKYNTEERRIASSDQLLSLLVTMTKNRIIDLARKHKRTRASNEGQNAKEVSQIGQLDVMLNESGPSTVVTSRDLAEHIRTRMSDSEFAIVELRNEGFSWREVADELGGSAEALRKQLERALGRVRQELNKSL